MFSQLLDRKLMEFQNRTPSADSSANRQSRTDTDDIKDDYIEAIIPSSPIKQQQKHHQERESNSRVRYLTI